jgi:NhaP-type Na+/H+ or K+/H+ antiporter
VVVSIVVHGTSATLVTRRLDARREDERSTTKMEA